MPFNRTKIIQSQNSTNLDDIVDEPLQGGERPDHDRPRHEALPESHEAEGLGRRREGRALGLVHV